MAIERHIYRTIQAECRARADRMSEISGHDGLTGGHVGEKRTQTNISERFYWRSITEDVKEFVSVQYMCISVIILPIK